jgi:tape measure domain-containing protein
VILRELINKIGFKVDEKAFENADKKFVSLAKKAKYVSAAAGGLAFGMIKGAAGIQAMTSQWETLLGSADKADAMFQRIKDFSSSTPFQLEDLNTGSQRLKAFGIEEEKIIETMRMLGDTAGGNAQKLDTMTRAFGKTSAKGKASMEELNMMIDAGVPILGTLADMYGKSEAQIIKMASTGSISSDMITSAFQKMTSEGGQFYKGMERQSQTLNGKISTLKDNFFLLGAGFGETLLKPVGKLTDFVTNLVKKFQNMSDTGKKVVVFLTLFTAGLAPALLIIGKIIGLAGTAVKVAKMLKGAILAVNTVLMANPIALVVIGVAALIAIIVLLIKNLDKVKEKARDVILGIGTFFNQAKELSDLAVMILVKQLMLWFLMFWNWFSDRFPGLAQIVSDTFSLIEDLAGSSFGFFKSLFQGLFALFTGDIDGFKDHFISAFSFLQEYFASLIDFMGIDIGKLWGWIEPLYNFLTGKLSGAVDKIRGGIDKVGDFLGFGDESAPQPTPAYGSVIRPGVNNNSHQVNVQSSITLAVPEGTPQFQQQSLRENAERAVQSAFNRQLKSVIANTDGGEVR